MVICFVQSRYRHASLFGSNKNCPMKMIIANTEQYIRTCIYIYIYIYIKHLLNFIYQNYHPLVVWISETNLDFYHPGFSIYCLYLYRYIHNVLADMPSGLFPVFVQLGSQHETSNHIHYLIHLQLLDYWRWFPNFLETKIWRLQGQSCRQASNSGILSNYTWLWLTESEQVTPYIK